MKGVAASAVMQGVWTVCQRAAAQGDEAVCVAAGELCLGWLEDSSEDARRSVRQNAVYGLLSLAKQLRGSPLASRVGATLLAKTDDWDMYVQAAAVEALRRFAGDDGSVQSKALAQLAVGRWCPRSTAEDPY